MPMIFSFTSIFHYKTKILCQ